MKKIYRLGITMLLVLAAALPTAFAYNFVSDGIYYDITGGSPNTVSVTYATGSYNSYSGNVDIPSTVTYNGTTYTVTAVGNNAFRNCSNLTGVTIPNTVTSIGESAFYYCGNLHAIDFPNALTNIGPYAFQRSGLYSVTIPAAVVTIGTNAFGNCTSVTSVIFNATNCTSASEIFKNCSYLTSLTIGNNVQTIPSGAFAYCNALTSVYIPHNVSNIGDNPFHHCAGLDTIIVAAGNSVFSSGFNYNAIINTNTHTLVTGCKSTIIPNAVTQIGGAAFAGCTGLTGSYTIPSQITVIGASAYSGCTGLTSLTIGHNVDSIGNSAFSSCSAISSIAFNADSCRYMSGGFSSCNSLSSLSIGNTVKIIPADAFGGCSHLTGMLVIPNSVKTIGGGAFYGCNGLTSLSIGNSVTSIGNSAFHNCSVMGGSLTIPQSVKSIGSSAFYNCPGFTSLVFNADSCTTGSFSGCTNVTSLTIGNNVKVIPQDAFKNLNHISGSLVIPNSVQTIGQSAFTGCSGLTSIIIGESVQTIGQSAFSGCSGLTSIIIGESVQTIDQFAFSGCSGLTTLTIGHNVNQIGKSAFQNCTGLSSIYFNADSCISMNSVFPGCTNPAVLTIGNNVKRIPNYAFYGYSGLTGTVYIPDSVNTIGGSAFGGCSGITSITFGTSLKDISSYAFKNCSGISGTVLIPNAVKVLGESAFENCSGIDSLIIGKSVSSIWRDAFQNCSGLSYVEFNADSCSLISYPVFSGCTTPASLTIGDNVKNIPVGTFKGLNIQGKLIFPDSVINIGNYAFENCSGMDSLIIGKSVSYIGSDAFQNCSGLSYVEFNADSCSSISYPVFSGCTTPASLTIGGNVKNIPIRAFKGLNIQGKLIIPNSVINIGNYAFENHSGIDSLIIGKSVTCIGLYAFQNCSGLSYVEFNADSCVSMGSFNDYAYPVFTGCGHPAILIIGNNVKNIPADAFRGLNIHGLVNIPNSVEIIGDHAFQECIALDSLIIGTEVSFVGRIAFENCSGLSYVEYNADSCSMETDNWASYPFGGCTSSATLIIGENVRYIPKYCFYGFTGLNGTLIIPDSVNIIGREAFQGCSGLDSVVVGKAVLSMYQAFKNCTGLSYVAFNADSCIDAFDAFGGCDSLTSLSIGENVKQIPSSIFSGRSSLTGTLTIPDSVIVIGNYAFYNCTGLVGKLNIPNSATEIGSCAFYGCSGFDTLIIGNSATVIGSSAFNNCTGLSGTLTIPNSVTLIKGGAFRSCSSIDTLIIGNSVQSIEGGAFYDCSALTSIFSYNEIPPTLTLGSSATSHPFGNVNRNIPVYVPCGSAQAYRNAWKYSFNSSTSYFNNIYQSLNPYSLTAVSEDTLKGSVQITSEATCTTPAVIEATPNFFYIFDYWSDGNTDNPRTITLTQDTTLVAHFREYSVIVGSDDSVAGMAVVTVAPSAENPQATIEAVVTDSCYVFSKWSDGSTDNPHTISVTQDTALTATFHSVVDLQLTVPTYVCAGDTAILVATGAVSYYWFNGDTSSVIKILPENSLEVFVTGVDNNGCSVSATQFVNVIPKPTLTISGKTNICEGENTVLTAYGFVQTDSTLPLLIDDVVLFEDFEDGLDGWYTSDFDGDGYTWYSTIGTGMDAYEGNGAIASNSYDNSVGVLYPDNLIYTNVHVPTDGAQLSWYAAAQDPYYPHEHYEVWVLPSSGNQGIVYIVFSETLSDGQWVYRTADLDNWAGEDITIGFAHTNCSDEYILKIDNVRIATVFKDTYVWNNGNTTEQLSTNQAGEYRVTYTSPYGCSTTDSVTVTVWQPDTVDISVNSHNNYYIMNDETFCQSGDYTQTLQNVHGCDSVINLHLTVSPSITVVNDTVYGSYYRYSSDGTEVYVEGYKYTDQYKMSPDKYAQWADSVLSNYWIDSTCLTFSYDSSTSMASMAYIVIYYWKYLPGNIYCEKNFYLDNTYIDSVYYDVFDTLKGPSLVGCDSTVIFWHTRIYFRDDVKLHDLEECAFVWQGDSLFLSGTSASGSTVLGFAAGDTLTESGTYKQNLTNISGCDSIIRFYFTIHPFAYEEIFNTACESYTLNGVTYTESGDYEQNSDTTMAITRNLFWRTYYSCGYWNSLGLFKSYKPADWSNLYTQYNSDGGTTYYFYNGNGDTIYLDSLHQVVQYIDTVYACKETTLHLTINQTVTTSFEVTACDSYTWNDSIYTVSGDYTQTFTTANGCDSVVTLHLTLNYAETAEFSETACDSYTWNETIYTSSGDYTQTFTNVDGCDSTVTLHLTVNTSDHTDLTATACGEYVWQDSTYTASGNYSITYTNVMGCDSIVTLHLTINPIPEVAITGNTTICPGGSTILTATGADSYQWSNGSTNASIPVNAFGQYSVIGTNATGCFSNASVTVLVSQPPVITISGNTDICAGESTTLTVNGGVSYMWSDGSTDSVRTVSVGGTWQVIGYNEIGCSGMTSVTVNVWQPAATNLYITAFDSCYVWFGTPYCESGDYTYTLQTIHGCDSVITLHLTLEDAITNEFNATGCDSYTWNSITYTQSGDYTQTLAGASGYDSIVTMHLTLYSSVTSEFSITTPDSCYIWNGISYCTSGDYSQTLQTVHGCDSVVTLHLTITVGIDDHNFGASMTVYPNPTTGIVNVECIMNNEQGGMVKFHVFDAFGRLLSSTDGVGTNNDSSLQTAQLDLSKFAAGVYFVKAVTDGNIIAVRKVVKR